MEVIDESAPYLCGCDFDDNEGQAHIYDCDGVGPNSFTKAELMSIHLNQIVTKFRIPRNAYRELVRFANTLIRDHDEIVSGKIK